jgi:hypothetical protein
MRRIAFLSLLPIVLVTLGAGCGRDVAFVPAPQTTPIDVKPNVEGAQGSMGGQSATVTPQLATQNLIRSLPKPSKSWAADEPRELKQPVPLPDGTATEYVSVARDYTSKSDGKIIKVLISDTRGIPALTAFLDSYQERSDDAGVRTKISIMHQDTWLTYTYGPNREADGQGSITLLYRGRFLIEIDGEQGIGAETLKAFASSFQFDTLN